MIRQLCPHCNALAELPDTAAGTAADCPHCGKPIPVPPGYTPTVAPPPEPTPVPPPGFVPPKPPSAVEAAPTPTVTLPHWLAWLPAVALTVALLAGFFPWVGSYPGGIRVYTQNPWEAVLGRFSTAILPDGLTEKDEPDLRAAVTFSGWLVPYLPLLLVAVAFAWAERLVPANALAGLPPRLRWLARLGPHRNPLLTAATVLLLLLVALQTWRGYGLERAVTTAVAGRFATQAEEARGNQNRETRVAVLAGYDANRLGVQGCTALDVAVIAHLLAAAGAAGRWWLARRGDKPLPRLVLQR